VQRVAQRFALIAAGGELAIEAGVLPWPAGEATSAAARCFGDWLLARGGVEAAEVRDGLAQLRSFLLANGQARFVPAWEMASDQRLPVRDVAGFRKREGEGWDFFVTTAAWREEVCAGLNAQALAGTLAERGLLLVPYKGPHRAKLVTVPGHGKLRLYHLPARLLRERAMTERDWSGALATALQRHLEIGGSGGSSVSHAEKLKQAKHLRPAVSGTPRKGQWFRWFQTPLGRPTRTGSEPPEPPEPEQWFQPCLSGKRNSHNRLWKTEPVEPPEPLRSR
jgi:hypothetical protein